uniref:Prothymosin alpha-like n=1 Tax=Parastrongyloides trichosuri TaxID=131310 RepID=A0A0N4Z7B0_PARTI
MATLKRKNEEAIVDDDNAKVIKIDEEINNIEKENTEETVESGDVAPEESEETPEPEGEGESDGADEETGDVEEETGDAEGDNDEGDVDDEAQPSVENNCEEEALPEGDVHASAPEAAAAVDAPTTDECSSASESESPKVPTPEVVEEGVTENTSNVEESSVVEPVA